MKIEDAVEMIDPRWRNQFLCFIQTGEADDAEFVLYLDKDIDAQKAVEIAFDEQAQSLEGLSEELKNPVAPILRSAVDPSTVASESMVEAVRAVSQLPLEQRADAMDKTAHHLVALLGGERLGAARLTLQLLQKALGVEDRASSRPT